MDGIRLTLDKGVRFGGKPILTAEAIAKVKTLRGRRHPAPEITRRSANICETALHKKLSAPRTRRHPASGVIGARWAVEHEYKSDLVLSRGPGCVHLLVDRSDRAERALDRSFLWICRPLTPLPLVAQSGQTY